MVSLCRMARCDNKWETMENTTHADITLNRGSSATMDKV